MNNSKQIDALRTVLDFVYHRLNADEYGGEVEQAAQILQDYLTTFELN